MVSKIIQPVLHARTAIQPQRRRYDCLYTLKWSFQISSATTAQDTQITHKRLPEQKSQMVYKEHVTSNLHVKRQGNANAIQTFAEMY